MKSGPSLFFLFSLELEVKLWVDELALWAVHAAVI